MYSYIKVDVLKMNIFKYIIFVYFCNIHVYNNKFCLCVDAQPTDGERPVFEEVQRVLRSSEGILEELGVYKGAGREIREAITTPNEECQKKAWRTVVPLVVKLKRFYDFSLKLGK